MSDIIFWYTGAAVWAVIAVLFAAALLIAMAAGVIKAWHCAGEWMVLTLIGRGEVRRVQYALKRVGAPSGDLSVWAREFRSHYDEATPQGEEKP